MQDDIRRRSTGTFVPPSSLTTHIYNLFPILHIANNTCRGQDQWFLLVVDNEEGEWCNYNSLRPRHSDMDPYMQEAIFLVTTISPVLLILTYTHTPFYLTNLCQYIPRKKLSQGLALKWSGPTNPWANEAHWRYPTATQKQRWLRRCRALCLTTTLPPASHLKEGRRKGIGQNAHPHCHKAAGVGTGQTIWTIMPISNWKRDAFS